MSIVAPIQGHFDGGEVSPLFYGRVDSERYKYSMALCRNWIPTLQGGLLRRPGSYYINSVKNSANYTRLIPFEFSTTQAYMIEFGIDSGSNGYIRFYMNYGVIVSSGTTAYEIPHPYLQSELSQIRYTQNADVLYLVHRNHPPMKLERFGQTNWQLVKITFIDGPYLTADVTDFLTVSSLAVGSSCTVTVLPENAVGSVANNGSGLIRVFLGTFTSIAFETGQQVYISGVTGTTEANGLWTITVPPSTSGVIDLQGSAFVNSYLGGGEQYTPIFASTDIGRLFRGQQGSVWGWGNISSYTSPISVGVTIQSAFGTSGGAGPYQLSAWRFGAWSQTTGFPGAVSFHEDRLTFAGATNYPQRIDGSTVSNYENFAPTQTDGTVIDSNALSFSLNANDVNLIAWLNSDEKGLLAGSVSAEWIIRATTTGEALTPTNISAKRSSKSGSQQTNSVQVAKAALYIQRGGRKLRELMYYFDIDGFRSTDLTEIAEHITGSGVVDITYQSLPISVVWLVRNDGALIGVTYDRDSMQLRIGWHQHFLGGQSDAAGTAPVVESIATIPDPTGVKDDVWMVVRRYINGQTVRTIEYLTKIFEDIDSQNKAYNLDCGLTYDNPITVTAATQTNPVKITATAHGLSTGNQVVFANILGMSELNGNWYQVTVIDANNFTISDLSGNPTNGTGFPAFISSINNTPQVRKLVTTISGLSYLQGETVSIYADGCYQPPQVVSNTGTITLELQAATVSVGYGYNSDGKLLRLEAGSRNGTSLGKTRRIHRVGFMVHRAQGLQFGKSFNSLDPIQFRTQGVDNNDRSSPLFSGIQTHECDFDYDFDNEICFRVASPVPCTLLAIMPQMETQDRA